MQASCPNNECEAPEEVRASSTSLSSLGGLFMPLMGYGTYQCQDPLKSVQVALSDGYRLIDTARVYKNEVQVGEAIRNAVMAYPDQRSL